MEVERLEVYPDRFSVAALRSLNKNLESALRNWSMGKTDQRETVHFCGLVQIDPHRQAVFLPRGMHIPEASDKRKKAAALTLQALARYGNDATNRQFEDDGQAGNPGALAVIARLSEDFRKFGLFIERQRIRVRNVGKPDWKRTISRKLAYVSVAQQPVYLDIEATRTADSSDNILAQIQAAVMAEILDRHGWWLPNISTRKLSLFGVRRPQARRAVWAKMLSAILPTLYSRRSIFLATYMIYYLHQDRANKAGGFVFGVEDFQTVWEAMLRQTLDGVEPNWNRRLPKPSYVIEGATTFEETSIGMKTDLIIRESDRYIVADAKYYGATSSKSAPPWPDIVKQIMYEDALRSVIGSEYPIRNCFIFPTPVEGKARLKKVYMKNSDGQAVEGFPEIECLYLKMEQVIRSYCGHHMDLNLPAAPQQS